MASQLQRSSHQIFMIQMDAESSPSPQTASLPCRQVALLTASIRSVLAAHACREGLEGPSLTRLREAPQVEIFQNSQDGSLVTTPRRPVLHWWLSMRSHPRLQESSLLKAAQQLQMAIGNTRRTICGAGIRQGCVTAPGITKLLLGPPSCNTPKDFLLQMGSVQGATAKAGIKPTFPRFQGTGSPACPCPMCLAACGLASSWVPWTKQGVSMMPVLPARVMLFFSAENS